MKKTIILFAICICSIGAFAQDGEKRKEKREAIEAKKIAFITQAINLTPEEAQVFWPLYNQKNEQERALKKELKPNFDKGNMDNMTEAQIERELRKGLQLQEELVKIEKRYFDAFKDVISVKQIARLHRAEKRFKVEVVKQFKQREGRGDRRGPNAPQ